MTNAPSSSSSQQPGYEPAATPPQVTARRTLLQQTLRDTFTRPGARIGVVWITILATVGIFAPLLANSAPLLIKEKATGAISSPVLSTLRPSDITLAVIYVVTITLLLWKRFSLGQSIVMILAAGLLAFLPSFLLIKSQDAPVYERYRLNEAAGQYEWVVRTIVPFSPNDRVNDVSGTKLKSPSGRHWLGTSIFGEDVLSRMMYACRVALTIGLISTGIAVTIGIFVGGLMGYFAGVFDLLAMRCIEILEAIPRLILLLIITVFFGRSLYLMMTVIGLIGWTADARFIRAEFLRLRNLDFVAAAKALGLPLRSIIFKHMLPNGIAPVLVNASFSVAGAILLESTLSFLGLGLGAEDPSWGQLLNQARSGGTGFNWWIATFPGVAIFFTVFSYVLIGEAMRDALDPKLRKRE
mgnify:CR=1 FL=1